MKRIIIILVALVLMSCNQPDDALKNEEGRIEKETSENTNDLEGDIKPLDNEDDLFYGLREDSYGKYTAKIIEVGKEYLTTQIDKVEMDILKAAPFLNLKDFSSVDYEFKVGEEVVLFIKQGTPVLNSNPPKITPKLIVREDNGYEAELDRFHLVDEYLLSTNNRIKVLYSLAISAPQVWDLEGNYIIERPLINDYLIIYKDLKDGTPPMPKYQTIIDIPDEGEIVFGEGFRDFIELRSIDIKRQVFLDELNNPSSFFSRDYEYFGIRESFERGEMVVLWDDEREVIEVKNNNEMITINPKTKKFFYKGEEREIMSLISLEGVLYAPRDFFGEALQYLIRE